MTATRQRILDTARGLFNAQGLHRVGVREIARAAGMSAGNLSYHFATKDDLVTALVLELVELNARTVFADVAAGLSLVAFYAAAVGAMRNMLAYRFVLLSYVDAVRASPALQASEQALAVERRRRSDAMLGHLVRGGLLTAKATGPRAAYLYEQGQMVSSGWLNHAALEPRHRSDEAVVLHYAKVGCALLEPYCTPKGARQMKQILAGAHDDAAWRGAAAARTR